MKWIVIYLALCFIVTCADDVADHGDRPSVIDQILRAIFWPITVTSFFRSQSIKLHRLLNILWCVLILGWLVSLLADRL